MDDDNDDSYPRHGFIGFFPNPPSPHFYKIILSEEDLNRVSIPKEFIDAHQIPITDTVLLKLPRSLWRIGITNSCGQVWMEFGWKNFIDYYSITFGYFLWFRYDGSYNFRVVIINNENGYEIAYRVPYRPPGMNDDSNCSDEETYFHEYVDISPTPTEDEEVSDLEEQEVQEDIPFDEKMGSIERVSSFKSDHPFCIVFMNPTYVSGQFKLYLPAHFVRIYLRQLPNSIKLLISDERIWLVNCSGTVPERFCMNWGSFVNDNKLKVGDVCVFELIKRGTDPHLRVVISKREDLQEEDMLDDEEDSLQIVTKLIGNMSALQMAEAFVPLYPYFNVLIRKSYIQRGNSLHIPINFSKENGLRPSRVLLSVSDGRTWTVMCKGYDYLSLAWIAFVRDNNLNIGDVCTFELIKSDKVPVFEVSIFREERGTGNRALQIKNKTESIQEDKTAAIERASAYKSKHPCAVVLLRKNYLSDRFDLCLPRLFTRKYFASKPKTAILCIPDETIWPVKCFCRGPRDKRSIQGFSWELFAMDNDLKEGDACVFELIKNDVIPLLRVIIFREFHDQQDHSNLSSGMTSGMRTSGMEDVYIESKSQMNGFNRKGKSSFCEVKMDAAGESTALERAKAFKSECPSVVISLQQSDLSGSNGLCLPRRFARKYLTINTKVVKLQVRESGKEWDVICSNHATNVSVVHLVWHQFVEENNLKIGDVCVFVVIDEITPVLEVVIFRNNEEKEEALSMEDSD